MNFSKPVTDIIRQRWSCRKYADTPLAAGIRRELVDLLAPLTEGPLGSRHRFELVAATEEQRGALRGLGTYGFIVNPPAFIVGAMGPGAMNYEDYGYLMEIAILRATAMGLGTCWLGGTFTKSSFSRRIRVTGRESVPAVASVGYPARGRVDAGVLTPRGSRTSRLPWESLFFDGRFGKPLPQRRAGAYAAPLEMLRIGPSASNKQPWRMIRTGDAWHLYLQRTPGYRTMLIGRLIALDDMQRLDMGIAMCHFGLAAGEAGLAGRWTAADPGIAVPDALTGYVASWVPS